MANEITIPTYIIHKPDRTDDLMLVRSQFRNKKEFDIEIVDAEVRHFGVTTLWTSIRQIIKMAIDKDEDVIILCTEEHKFTTNYNVENFISVIYEAHRLGANILLGGISAGGTNLLPLSSGLFWLDTFLGWQFIVVYSNFYQAILEEPFSDEDLVDIKLSEMTSNKFVIHPMISVQKDFGSSEDTDARILNQQHILQSVKIRMEDMYEVYQRHKPRKIDKRL